MWAVVRELRATGSTVLLTTQYLEEADQLADEIVVIDQGTVIAAGTPDELKDRVGGSMCEVHIEDERLRARAVEVLASARHEVTHNNGSITLAGATPRTVTELIRCLDNAGIEANNVAVRRPTLEDVFFALTGHGTQAEVRK